MSECPSSLLDAVILQGLTLGRLPRLIAADDAVEIAWTPEGVRTLVSVGDLPIIYDSILFHAADSPLPLDKVIASARRVASAALRLGVEVEFFGYRRIKI